MHLYGNSIFAREEKVAGNNIGQRIGGTFIWRSVCKVCEADPTSHVGNVVRQDGIAVQPYHVPVIKQNIQNQVLINRRILYHKCLPKINGSIPVSAWPEIDLGTLGITIGSITIAQLSQTG